MRRATTKERATFERHMVEHMPKALSVYVKERFAQRCLRVGATVGRVAEQACNGPNPPAGLSAERYNDIYERWQVWQDAQEARADRLVAKLRADAVAYGCDIVEQGDPRGATLRVVLPDGFGDSWGDPQSLCVPTS